MGKQGDSAIQTLEELGLTDARLLRSFLGVAGAGDKLRQAIELSNKAWEENTALTKEAELRYKTTENQIVLLKNQLRDILIEIGFKLLPVVNEIITRGREWLGTWPQQLAKIRDWFGKVTVKAMQLVGKLSPALGQIVWWLGKVLDGTVTWEYAVDKIKEAWRAIREGFEKTLVRITQAVSDVSPELGQVVWWLGKALDGTVSWQDAFAKIGPTIRGALADLLEGRFRKFTDLLPFTDQQRQTIQIAFDVIRGDAGLGDLFASAKATVEEALAPIIAFGQRVWDTLAPFLRDVKELWDYTWPRIVRTVKPILEDLRGYFDRLATWASEVFLENFGQIAAWVHENMPLIKQTISTVLIAIGKVWDWFWGWASQVADVMLRFLRKTIGAELTMVLGIFKGVMQIINGDWAAGWETIKTALVEFWKSVSSFIEEAWEGIKAIFGPPLASIWQAIVDWADGIITSTKTWADNLITSMVSPFVEAWDFLLAMFGTNREQMGELVDAFVGFIGRRWEECNRTWGRIWEAIRSTIVGVLESLWSFIEPVVQPVIDKLTEWWTTITGWFQASGDTAAAPFEETWTRIKEAVQWVLDKFNDVWMFMVETFSPMWEGFKIGRAHV